MGVQTAVIREAGIRTYSHFRPRSSPPSEYELVTSRLNYYVSRGFEVNSPLAAWYRDHQQSSRFRARDWDSFADPRETTYTTYTRLQRAKEAHINELLLALERDDTTRPAQDSWVSALGALLGPIRYLFHGFHMVASYLGHMAPSGRITIAALFQAADELRRIERCAYRLRQLQILHPGWVEAAKGAWQADPIWQPAREAVEKLLVPCPGSDNP